jgi:hypothetical protein
VSRTRSTLRTTRGRGVTAGAVLRGSRFDAGGSWGLLVSHRLASSAGALAAAWGRGGASSGHLVGASSGNVRRGESGYGVGVLRWWVGLWWPGHSGRGPWGGESSSGRAWASGTGSSCRCPARVCRCPSVVISGTTVHRVRRPGQWGWVRCLVVRPGGSAARPSGGAAMVTGATVSLLVVWWSGRGAASRAGRESVWCRVSSRARFRGPGEAGDGAVPEGSGTELRREAGGKRRCWWGGRT